MRSDIMIRREILLQGFSVNMTATQFKVSKSRQVNHWDLSSVDLNNIIRSGNTVDAPSINDFIVIDTNVSLDNKFKKSNQFWNVIQVI